MYTRYCKFNLFFAGTFIGAPTADGELYVGMQFRVREAIMRAIKSYSISKGVYYRVYKSEPMTYYCKCVQYGIDCGWLISASFRRNKYYWEIRKYNGPHTCIGAKISQDHMKLSSDTIAKCIEPLVGSAYPLR